MDDFVTPPDHVGFLAKKLFGPCGQIKDGAIAYLEPGGGGPVEMHTHAHDHLFVVVEGSLRIQEGDQEVVLGPNESRLVRGRTVHSVWNGSTERAVVLGISVEGDQRPF